MGCGSSTQNSSKAPSSAAQGRSSKSKGLNDDKGANSTFLKDKKAAKSSLKGSKSFTPEEKAEIPNLLEPPEQEEEGEDSPLTSPRPPQGEESPRGGLKFSPSTKQKCVDDPPDPPDLDDLGVPVSASAQAILTAMEEAERDMFPSDDSKPTVNPALGSGPTSPAAASSPVLKSIGSMRKMPSVRLHLGDDVTLIPGISPDEGTGTPSSRGSRFGGAATQGGPKGSGGVFGATGGPPKRMGSGRIVVMDAGGDVFLSQGPAASSVT